MPQCIIYGCLQQGVKGSHSYGFPNPNKNKEEMKRYKMWVNASHNANIHFTKNPRVCIKHFKQEDFEPAEVLKRELMPGAYKSAPPLKETAVPTLFLPSSSSIAKASPHTCCDSSPRKKKNQTTHVAVKEKKQKISALLSSDKSSTPKNCPVNVAAGSIKSVSLPVPKISKTDFHLNVVSDTDMIGGDLTLPGSPPSSVVGDNSFVDPDFLCDVEKSSGDDTSSVSSDISGPTPSVQSKLKYENGYFLVKYECLKQLVSKCQQCGGSVVSCKEWTTGSMLSMRYTCETGHAITWQSQPVHGAQPEGNAVVASAALLSGLPFTTLKEFSDVMKLQMMTPKIFHRMVNNYVEPVVVEAYKEKKEEVKDEIRSRGSVRLAGDGQHDSPGFSADVCTYSMQDVDTGAIVDFEIVTKNMVTGCLEKAAFENLFPKLTDDLNVSLFASDRHVSIRAIMKKEYPQIAHEFDSWHVYKSVAKKVKHLFENSEALSQWRTAFDNHFWWSCSSSQGNGVEVKEKVTSFLHHVTDNHVNFRKNQHFKACAHGELHPENRNFYSNKIFL